MKTDRSKKFRMQKLISVLITVIGVSLMAFMVIVEDEPGAIPLLLIVTGTGWYLVTRYRIQSMHKRPGQIN